MKKQWKKAVSIGCTACMLVSTMPMSGLHLIAEAQGIETQSDEAATSGTWGTCTWEVKDGVLTISGGVAESLENNGAPWKSINKDIQKVNITGNITFDKEGISLSGLFFDCWDLTEISGLEKIDTSRVTDMSDMFNGCRYLKEVDVSEFDTSQVTNMSGIFSGCIDLKELDVSGFDTSRVTDMSGIFSGCLGLEELDVSGFDTSRVTNMSNMFSGCNGLKELDVSGFDTSQVTDMSEMLGCWNVSELDVSGFDTSQVTNMSGMFAQCRDLQKLDVSRFDTSQVTDMSYMFWLCEDLQKLDLSGFDTSQVTDMSEMFAICYNLQELDISGFDTSQVTCMSHMFWLCEDLQKLDLSGFDTSQVKDMSDMFNGCRYLKEVDASGFDTSQVKDMSDMFNGCRYLKEVDVSGFDTGLVTNMMGMFKDCNTLEKLDLSNFDLSNVQDVRNIVDFSNITDITMPKILNENVDFYSPLMEGMKFGKWTDVTENISYETKPDNLQAGHRYILAEQAEVTGTWGTCAWEWKNGTLTVDGGIAQSTEKGSPFISDVKLLSKADIYRVNIIGDITFAEEDVSLNGMFADCKFLRQIDGLGKIDMSKVTNIEDMFKYCIALRQIDMSGWNLGSVKKCGGLTYQCKFDFIAMPDDTFVDDETKLSFMMDFLYDKRVQGSWYDVTAGVDYEQGLLEAGHKYIRKEAYEKKEDIATGVIIEKEDGSMFDTDMELKVSDVTTSEDYANYTEIANELGKTNKLFDIALEKDGTAVQPDGTVLVSIPLPDGMSEATKVYRIAKDGTATDMNAAFADGYLTFATAHFSVYAVVDENAVLGDVNGDGIFNMADAALVRRYVANMDVSVDTSAADVNKDGKIDMVDYALMRRALANWDVELK